MQELQGLSHPPSMPWEAWMTVHFEAHILSKDGLIALPDPVLPRIRGFKRAENGQVCVLRHVGIGVQNKRLNIT